MTSRIPARAWLRPALLVIGGLLVAAILLGMRLWWGGAAVALAALFMGYWTSPVRGGQHVPFGLAMSRRADDHAIILWAPGDPLSARLQTAIRGERPDVTWVNVYQDADADAFVLAHGGHAALPLVLIGDEILRRTTMGRYLDARAAAAESGTSVGADRARATQSLAPEPWGAPRTRDDEAATEASTSASHSVAEPRSPAEAASEARPATAPRSPAMPAAQGGAERPVGPSTPVDLEADRDALLPDDSGN